MLTRRTVAIAVLGAWLITLAFLYRRSSFRTPDQALLEAALRVAPATYYYTIEQGDQVVGVAASGLDTTETRIVATDYFRVLLPVGPDSVRLQGRSEARFTRGFRLRDFIIRADGNVTPVFIRGVVEEGGAQKLRVVTEARGEQGSTTDFEISSPVFVPTVGPVPLMLTRGPRPGETMQMGLFDPLRRSLREVELTIGEDSLFSIPDSAEFDSVSRRWISASRDTVRGWRLEAGSPAMTVWIDAGGRLLFASEPGGLAVRRTAFEIAFTNWEQGVRSRRIAASVRPLHRSTAPR